MALRDSVQHKVKAHWITHAIDHIQTFGDFVPYCCEIMESINGDVRAAILKSNGHAPSRDVARRVARTMSTQFMAEGGQLMDTPAHVLTRLSADVIKLYQEPKLHKLIDDIDPESTATSKVYTAVPGSTTSTLENFIVIDWAGNTHTFQESVLAGALPVGLSPEYRISEKRWALLKNGDRIGTRHSVLYWHEGELLRGWIAHLCHGERRKDAIANFAVIYRYDNDTRETPFGCQGLLLQDRDPVIVLLADIDRAFSVVHDCFDACRFATGSQGLVLDHAIDGKFLVNHFRFTEELEAKPPERVLSRVDPREP
ncbi:hypothetical protein BC828DRAFT_401152 [Blastocladiella britannica]|nr:hypothetical protein BC828DRAFT_401152 [Blastocladiella britannica]